MFESNLAELEPLAAVEATNSPVVPVKAASVGKVLTDLQSVALLRAATAQLRRRRSRRAQFRDNSNALFRPFRIY